MSVLCRGGSGEVAMGCVCAFLNRDGTAGGGNDGVKAAVLCVGGFVERVVGDLGDRMRFCAQCCIYE